MEENHFIRAKEVAKILDCSESRAYKIIKQLKDELKEQGYIVLAGRVPRNYFIIMGPLSRPLPKILRVPSDRTVLSSEAPKVELIRNLIA